MKGYFDIHTHILPDIDDGPDTLDLTMKMLQKEYDDGIRNIIATSHWRRGMFEPRSAKLLQQFELVKNAAKEIAEDLEIYLGCEFHANLEMVETLDQKKRPTMAGTRCVLTEFKNNSTESFIRERCYALLSHGYQPIIAHVERYEVIRKNIDFLEELADMGNYIQLNSQSVLGDDGFFMKQFCKKVIKNDLVDFIASDCHDMNKRQPTMGRLIEYLNKLEGEDYTRMILEENPKELIFNL